jgi:8-oxo-dGTP pyrophosphatase MutT (NUDIX family)
LTVPAGSVRPSARVVLIDDSDRLLLFSSHNRHDGSIRWYTPGGGLRPGEDQLFSAASSIRSMRPAASRSGKERHMLVELRATTASMVAVLLGYGSALLLEHFAHLHVGIVMLPVRTGDVLRRRTADALLPLGELLAP